MNICQDKVIRYSNSFKLQVIEEIESGKINKSSARKKYGIGGGQTISTWLKKFGKNNLMAKVVRVEKVGERDRIKKLEKEKRELESALANSQVQLLAYQSLVEVASKEMNLDIKKNFGLNQSQ